jgi:hypothetical protein
MSLLFKKGGINNYFQKGRVGNAYFRKGYNTLNKVGNAISNVAHLGEKVAPYAKFINPLIGTGLTKGAFVANSLGENLNKVATNAKMLKKSIEKGATNAELRPLIQDKKNQ